MLGTYIQVELKLVDFFINPLPINLWISRSERRPLVKGENAGKQPFSSFPTMFYTYLKKII